MTGNNSTGSADILRDLIENTDDIIWSVDTNYCLIYGNKSFHKYTESILNRRLKPGDTVFRKDLPPEIIDEIKILYDRALIKGEKFSTGLITGLSQNNLSIDCLFIPLHSPSGKIIGAIMTGRDIAKYKKNEEILKQSEYLLNETQLLSSIGGWNWDIKNDKMYWTKELFRLHDLDFNTEINTSTGLITNYIDCYPENDRTKVRETFRKCCREGEPYDFETQFTTLKGRKIWIRSFARPIIVKGEVVKATGYVMDITKQKRAEIALRTSERKFRNLVEQAGEMMFLHNSEGFILDVNQAAVNQTGYSRDELLNLSVYDIDPDAGIRHDKINFWELLKDTDKKTFETRHKRKDGSIYPAEITIGKIQFDDDFYILALARDISERKKTEEEILKSRENLIRMNAEKDKFFSIMAHDLRTPFTAFLGYTELIAEELHTMTLEEIQNMINIIRKSASNLYSLLDNLLQWSKLQRGVTTLKPERFNLLSTIRKSIDSSAESANNKKIEIIYSVPERTEIYADIHMFESIMRNLVSNAVKFTNRGGQILISARLKDGKKAEISVKDTGIGINKNILEKMFHLDGNISRKGTEGELSTGLGLILCKEFIEKHGEKISIESEEGKGSTFSFTMPVF
ncbi:MAG: PAS domain S-box protein [Ignavibacteria bacterium]|nr:PAS domain S-box protein [Ignavibacteria bacterium]